MHGCLPGEPSLPGDHPLAEQGLPGLCIPTAAPAAPSSVPCPCRANQMFTIIDSNLLTPLEALGLPEADPQAPLHSQALPVSQPSPALLTCLAAVTRGLSMWSEEVPLTVPSAHDSSLSQPCSLLPTGGMRTAEWPLTFPFGAPSPSPGRARVGGGRAGRAGHRGPGAAGEFCMSSAPSSLSGCASLGEKRLSSGRE